MPQYSSVHDWFETMTTQQRPNEPQRAWFPTDADFALALEMHIDEKKRRAEHRDEARKPQPKPKKHRVYASWNEWYDENMVDEPEYYIVPKEHLFEDDSDFQQAHAHHSERRNAMRKYRRMNNLVQHRVDPPKPRGVFHGTARDFIESAAAKRMVRPPKRHWFSSDDEFRDAEVFYQRRQREKYEEQKESQRTKYVPKDRAQPLYASSESWYDANITNIVECYVVPKRGMFNSDDDFVRALQHHNEREEAKSRQYRDADNATKRSEYSAMRETEDARAVLIVRSRINDAHKKQRNNGD